MSGGASGELLVIPAAETCQGELAKRNMAARVKCTTLVGIEAYGVDVETQIIGSLRRFSIVGLPDGVLREAKDRVRCAIENSGFEFSHREVVVSLAPASLPKCGSGFDLAIALSILAAEGHIPAAALHNRAFLGELTLDGRVKPVPGEIAAALYAQARGRELVVSDLSAPHAALVPGVKVRGIVSLLQAVLFLNSRAEVSVVSAVERSLLTGNTAALGFRDVIGQGAAKRAMEISAAGGHNLLMIGPPGAGKSMLARRMLSIVPPLDESEAIEVTKIYSGVAVQNRGGTPGEQAGFLMLERPFRTPHHTISAAGLIGGGSNPIPGEISLAHKGVLFLDEFVELRRDVLESLREPLENRSVVISRAKMRIRFPADFLLLAAMNPCPCGRHGLQPESPGPERVPGRARPEGPGHFCECPPQAIRRYLSRLSGPIVDRMDLQVWLPAVPFAELVKECGEDPTPAMRVRVESARSIQAGRYKAAGKLNTHLETEEIKRFCNLSEPSRKLLEAAARKLSLSARGYMRVMRVSRTVADLMGAEVITQEHLAEALSYRMQMG